MALRLQSAEGIEAFNPLPDILGEAIHDFVCPSPEIDLKGGVAANDEDITNEIDLTLPQIEFYESEWKYPLFVAGYGSGKSKTMALCAVRDLLNYPGANIGCYAPTFDLIGLIIVPYISELLDMGGYEWKYNGGKHWFDVVGFGRIICRSLDAPHRIVGYETFRAHADELDTLPEEKAQLAWEKMIARNRQKVYKLDENGKRIPDLDEDGKQRLHPETGYPMFLMHLNRVSAYTTPEGWRFAYNQWVERGANNPEYGYVKASTYSNAHNLPPDYIPSLEASYPPELIKAYVNGEWTNLTQGRVYKNFDEKLNRSFETIQDDDILHVGFDFNIEHCSALIFVERKDEECGFVEHAVDEITDCYDTDDVISVLVARYPKNRIFAYPDASGTKRASGASNSIDTKGRATQTDMWKLKKHFLVRVDSRNPPIKDSAVLVHGLMLNGKEQRRLKVNRDKCPNYWKTCMQQVWNNGIPDKSTGLDHLGDCGRYVMNKKHPIVKSSSGFIPVR